MAIKEGAKKQWQKVWNENTKTATALRRITKRKDGKSGPSLYNGLSNRKAMAKLDCRWDVNPHLSQKEEEDY
jgi:hypothetical protein